MEAQEFVPRFSYQVCAVVMFRRIFSVTLLPALANLILGLVTYIRYISHCQNNACVPYLFISRTENTHDYITANLKYSIKLLSVHLQPYKIMITLHRNVHDLKNKHSEKIIFLRYESSEQNSLRGMYQKNVDKKLVKFKESSHIL